MSWAIRACTWSRWSHVAIVDGQTVIEAVALHGVVRTPLDERLRQDPRWAITSLPCPDPTSAIAAAASQIGKPYDYTGVLGLGLHRDWQTDDAWWCAEHAAWSLQQGGSTLFRDRSLRRVAPEHLWMLRPVGETVFSGQLGAVTPI